MQDAWEASEVERDFPWRNWRPCTKYHPSLDGHLRRTHAPPCLVDLSRACAARLRDASLSSKEEREALTSLQRIVDRDIVATVRTARRALDEHFSFEAVLRNAMWRRAMLYARARVAARRVLRQRVAQ